MRSPRADGSALPAIPEAVLGELAAVAPNVEEDRLIHQARFFKCRDPITVGNEPGIVHRLELDERDATTGLFVNNLDREKPAGPRVGRDQRPA